MYRQLWALCTAWIAQSTGLFLPSKTHKPWQKTDGPIKVNGIHQGLFRFVCKWIHHNDYNPIKNESNDGRVRKTSRCLYTFNRGQFIRPTAIPPDPPINMSSQACMCCQWEEVSMLQPDTSSGNLSPERTNEMGVEFNMLIVRWCRGRVGRPPKHIK